MKLASILFVAIGLGTSSFFSASLAETAPPPSPVAAIYKPASLNDPLKTGEKIADLFKLNMEEPYVLQRLSQKTYWYQSGFYGTIFYIGDKGVLLFDPLEWRAELILKAIRSVTDKPIQTIVYSHAHADHIAGTPELLKRLQESQKTPPKIIASKETAAKLQRIHSMLPKANQTISWPNGSFMFENLKVELHGFSHAAHTDDHAAWLLVNERILHAPDLLNADQPPFWSFAGSERFSYLEENLKAANALSWDHFSGGHGNVGAHEDFNFHLKFIDDLKIAVANAMQEVPFGFGVDPKTLNAHTAMLPAWYGEITRRATEALRPTYGHYYGFESGTPANAQKVAEYLFSYR